MASEINRSNKVLRFQTSRDSLICWMTMVRRYDNNMYAVIVPSLTCEVEMSCEPLEEDIITGFLLDNDKNCDGKYVYLFDSNK